MKRNDNRPGSREAVSGRAWLIVAAGGLMDTVWAVLLHESKGLTQIGPSLAAAAAIVCSYMLYIISLRLLPAGTAYAVFTGIGAAGTALAGIVLLGESADFKRILFIAMLLLGITGLKLVSGMEEKSRPQGGAR